MVTTSVQNVCLLSLAFLSLSGVHALSRLQRRDKHGKLGVPLVSSSDPLPPDQWFTQVLDHFDPTNNQTWQQRYQVVKDYYIEGGPVFIMLGGEGEASAEWMVLGNWVNYAKQYNALMFQIEHRFYGKSFPTSDLSVENLRYLTTEQALADVAYFITGMNALYNLSSDTKWIAFGGSYSGNLAAWIRFKYPHLIHGAMAASGPVLSKVDFYEYMEVVRNSLATYGESCVEAVETANKMVLKLLKSKFGQKVLNFFFRLCDPINPSIQNDVYNLLESMADNLAGIVQYNKDNRAFRSSSWNITIDTVCDIMTDHSLGNPVVRYAAVNSLMLDVYDEPCLDYKYDTMIEELRNTSWSSQGGSFGERQWMYQTCTEFGFYQTSENKQEFFASDFPLQFFLQQCTDIYGDAFNEQMVNAGVYRSNIIYGGLDLKATRVVYVHGTIDPWHALGITYTRIPESPAILINGTAHCANMYPPSSSDLPALTAARQEVGTLIGQWLQEN
ncbi:putative serine protease K12H4.7 [Homalodisca vitripennis]|uniref:putative serine protease K12H4.7 n=1 Tax=Homalodisca vitripennis TaxID=197043 RepID=UPI001EEA29DA|nr:putative serine protease K12H4.7 [Homalodisca vitripennis]